MNDYAGQFSFIGKNVRLFRKILNIAERLPYPGEMKNLIRSSNRVQQAERRVRLSATALHCIGPRWGVGHPEHPHALRTGLYVTRGGNPYRRVAQYHRSGSEGR